MCYHSVAVVLTLVQIKQIRINIHKRNNTKDTVQKSTKHSKYKYTCYQNTHTLQNPHIHTPTHYKTHTLTHTHTHTYTPTHYKTHTHKHTHTHTLQIKLKQPQYKIHTKRSSHNTIKYPHPNVHGTSVPKNFTVTHFTSLHYTSTSLHFKTNIW